MGRYLLKFSKENNLKYISHLDLLRVFQRAFKRAHIRLRYSQGFNPHAKIGFGQPLSLGSESTGEYMEFETVEDRAGGEYLTALSGCMPDGIRLLSCTKLKEEGKTSLAAAVAYASYVVKFRGDGAVSGSVGILVYRAVHGDVQHGFHRILLSNMAAGGFSR